MIFFTLFPFPDVEGNSTEPVSSAQYSPATMLAAGKFKRYIKPRPPKSEEGAAAAGNGGSSSRRPSRQGSQDKLVKAGQRPSGGGGTPSVSRHGSQDKLSRLPETSRLLQRLGSLEMGRTKSDSQRRRKGFGILAQTTDCVG